jgi:hypothetical protein
LNGAEPDALGNFLFAAERRVLHNAKIEPARQLRVDDVLDLQPDPRLRLVGAEQRGDRDRHCRAGAPAEKRRRHARGEQARETAAAQCAVHDGSPSISAAFF